MFDEMTTSDACYHQPTTKKALKSPTSGHSKGNTHIATQSAIMGGSRIFAKKGPGIPSI